MKAIDSVNITELDVVYVDIDGVLSISRYPFGKNKTIVPFGSDNQWKPFIANNADGYAHCYASKDIYEWLRLIKSHGKILKTLSAGDISEIPAKEKFINTNYKDLFDEMLFVPSASDKAVKMDEEQQKYGFNPFRMALIEDHHNTLIDIADHGFRGIHTSWFLDVL